MRRVALSLLTAMALAACGDSPTDVVIEYPSLTGSWKGIGAAGFNFFDFTLELTQMGSGRITGTGRLQHVVPGQPSFNFTIRWGAYGYPDVLVSLFTPNLVDVNYSGRLTEENKIEGLMNGSGFNNVPITLTRR